jgi:hypothetical protein
MAWISVQATANLGGMAQWNIDLVCVACQYDKTWSLWPSRVEVVQACVGLRAWPSSDCE